MTRRESLLEKLYETAKSGCFILDGPFKLYKTEIKKLRRDGFTVIEKYDSNKKVHCLIYWNKPFSNGIPRSVVEFTTCRTDSIPEELNFAQRLYSIAARKNTEI